MPIEIPPGARGLIEGANFCHLATLMPDGSPQVTPVWVDLDGDQILFNTAEGRVKPRNLRRDPRVGLSIASQENPYEHATIRGHVVDISAHQADEHADRLTMKYLGQETYPFRQPGEVRLIVRIEPEKVHYQG